MNKLIRTKIIIFTIGLTLLSLWSTSCAKYTEYDKPHIPGTLTVPPIDEKFAALVGTINAINHFTNQSLNETTNYLDTVNLGEKYQAYPEDKDFKNEDPYFDLDEKGSATVFENSTALVNFNDDGIATKGFKEVKATFSMDKWVAPKAAHFSWEEFTDSQDSQDIQVSTDKGGVSVGSNFEVKGYCLDIELKKPVTENVLYYDPFTYDAMTQTSCEDEYEGEWNATDSACNLGEMDKFSCEFDAYGEEIPWQKWVIFAPSCSDGISPDPYSCEKSNLSWNANESKCQDVKGESRIKIKVSLAGVTQVACTALDSDGTGPWQTEWDTTKKSCTRTIFLDTAGDGSGSPDETKCNDYISNYNADWGAGTGFCSDYSHKTKEECRADSSLSWTAIPILGKIGEIVFKNSSNLDTLGTIDYAESFKGLPANSGLYSGTYTVKLLGDCDICDFKITLKDFFFESVFLDKYDEETGKFTEVVSYTYNGKVTINGQNYTIKENVVASQKGQD